MQIGPVSARYALQSKFPQHDQRAGIYSNSARITMHNQLCRLFDGSMVFENLKLYLKDNRQYAKTLGKRPKHFVKSKNMWIRIK